MSSTTTTTLARVATAAVLLLGLAACQAIEVHPDGSVTSHATRAVSPTTTRVGGKTVAAVEIRIRDCHTLKGAYEEPYDEIAMRPIGSITDGAGTLIFQNGHASGPVPEGTQVINGGTDDAHRIIVPVAGVKTPLTIGAGCTIYGGFGSGGPFNAYSLPSCRTSNRTCAASEPGDGQYSS